MRIALVVAALALGGCLTMKAPAADAPPSTPAGAQAREKVAGGARLVDVRSPGEFFGGHIPGAVNIPVGEIEARLAELEPKNLPVVVYCRSGRRSHTATLALQKAGFEDVFDLGGMGNW